jgi:hypothetical protein
LGQLPRNIARFGGKCRDRILFLPLLRGSGFAAVTRGFMLLRRGEHRRIA